jgi:hypothetical protein
MNLRDARKKKKLDAFMTERDDRALKGVVGKRLTYKAAGG